MYMLNHGLSTGALFLCVGMIYERFHTREMSEMSGLAKVLPIWTTFFVFFCLASVGLPGLNGFISEFLCLLGAFDWRTGRLGPGYAAVAGVGMILGAIYLLHMVGKVAFGPLKVPVTHAPAPGTPAPGTGAHEMDLGHAVRDLSLREIVVLLPLAVACIVIGLYPKPMLQSLEAPLTQMTQRVAQRPTTDAPTLRLAHRLVPTDGVLLNARKVDDRP